MHPGTPPPAAAEGPWRFESRHYREGAGLWRLGQEAFFEALAWCGGAVLLWLLHRIYVRLPITPWIWPLLVAAFGLAAWLAAGRLQSAVALIESDGFTFRVWSLHNLARRRAPEPFPLDYAALSVHASHLELHYHDRVLTLRPADWPAYPALRAHLAGLPI